MFPKTSTKRPNTIACVKKAIYKEEKKGYFRRIFLKFFINCSYVFGKIKQKLKVVTQEITVMQDEKNRNHKKNTDQELSGNQEEYHFLKEVIKEKPIDKRKILWRVGGIMAGAVLFGVVSAFTFAQVLPHMMPEEKNDKVDISEEPEQPSITPKPTEEPANQEEEKAEKEPPNLEELGSIFQSAVEMAEKPEKSLVTVQGITNNVDWMNNSYENEQQISGFLAADNDKSYFVVTEYRVVENVDRILVTFSTTRYSVTTK